MAEKHFYEQQKFTREYILPHLKAVLGDLSGLNALEVGCAEGGLLQVFEEAGISCKGIELEENRVALAKKLRPKADVMVGDITEPEITQISGAPFDLVVMRDVIEHVLDKPAAFRNLNRLLKPGGYLFVTFPPKYSPFAGHQQHARSFLKHTPWVSLWPRVLWFAIGKILGEEKPFLESVMHNHENGLSIRQFGRLYREAGFVAVKKDLFLFRPIFKYRMNLPIVRFPHIPLLKEFLSTGCEYILQKRP